MEQARKLLITELALARRVREETIQRDIDKILHKQVVVLGWRGKRERPP